MKSKRVRRFRNFFKNIDSAEKKEYNAVGVGTEKRFDAKDLAGFELQFNEHLIHMGVNAIQ